MRKQFSYMAWSFVVVAAGLPVRPGTAIAASASTADDMTLEEVVVTARRHDENLARVPAAITAIGDEALLERSIRTDSDLQLAVPGLTIRQTQGNNSLTYSIRGQTADTFSGSPSAVIAYFNEVPLTISGATSFYDLQSVQVLKGPQGTLFGRNGTGGSVLYTSAKPTDTSEAWVRVRGGNLELREVEGMVNAPLAGNKVLLRAAFNLTQRDGYIVNLLNNDRLGNIYRKSGRLTLTVNPSDKVSNTTAFQYTHTDGTNTGASYTYSVYPCGATNNGFALTCATGLLFGPLLDSVYGAGSWASYLAAHPQAFAAGAVAYVDEQRRIGPYATRHPGAARHLGNDSIISNTTTVNLGNDLQLKNILGASHSQTTSEQPQLGAPFVTILTANLTSGESGNQVDAKSVTEELQLQGKAAAGRFNYIAGLFLQRLQTDTTWPQTYFDLRPVALPATVTNSFRIKDNSSAVYAQGTWELSNLPDGKRLALTTGIRLTREELTMKQLPRATYTAGAPDQSNTFQDPSWEVGLEYQATPSLFSYLKTRGSFRSGGFNGAAPPVNVDATRGGDAFKSEHTHDVEAGLKYAGTAFSRPARLSVNIYNQWITDVQRVEFPIGPGGTSIAVTANVPSAQVRGLEAEGAFLPAGRLQVGGSLSYTHAAYTNGNILLFGTPFHYGPFADTPKLSGVLFAEVGLPTGADIGKINLRAEAYSQSEQYFSSAADSIAPGTRLPGYTLVHARISWDGIMHSKLSAALYGKNLTNKAYFVGGMQLAAALGHNAAAVGEPRTYGLELSYRY